MGALTNHVTITISRNSVGITRAGFGTMLILTPNFVGTGSEKTRSYSEIDGVATDYPNTTSFEYKAAEAAFSQNPRPERVKFGKLTAMTLIATVGIATVRNTYPYELDVKGKGVTSTRVSFTSDGSATNDEVVAGLVAALNLVPGKNYTAAATGGAGSQVVTITGTLAGDWFSISVVNVDDLSIAYTQADVSITADLNAIKLYDADFYALYLNAAFASNSPATLTAAWCESNKKILMCELNESRCITTAAGSSDTADDIKTASYDNTMAFYHHEPDQCAGAAFLGACLPLDPGSETWTDKNLSGVDPSPLTDTHRGNLTAKNANGYETVAGYGVTFEGKVGSGEFLDTIRFFHWFEDDAAKGIFGVKVANSKIPMANPGIATIVTELRASMIRGEERGGWLPGWKITFPKAETISSADRTARTLNGIKATATPAGAVHKINVTINVL